MKELSDTRFVFVSLKNENPFSESKSVVWVRSVGDVLRAFRKNHVRVAVFSPPEPDRYSDDVDSLLENVMATAEDNPDAKFVVVVDDCNIIDGFDNRGTPSASMKKAVIAGRSMGVKLGMVTHRLGNLPRIVNGNMSSIVVMDISEMDIEYASKVYGVNFHRVVEGLGGFRWAFVDLVDQKTTKFSPVRPL